MKSVALLTDGVFPFVIGGMQKHSFYLCKYLAASGVKVDLYHFSNNPNANPSELDLFSEDEKKNITNIIIQFPKQDKLPGHYLRASYKYSELIYNILIKRYKTDFIYAKGFSAWKLLEQKAKGMQLPPIGVNFHGFEMFQQPASLRSFLEGMLLRNPVKKLVQQADVSFSYGGKITGIIQKLGVSKSNIIEVPTGIQKNWLNNNVLLVNPIIKFIFIGRYERRKGIQELNQALEIINNSNHLPFEFHFVGPIPDDKKLKNDNIHYHGLMDDSNAIINIVSSCDVLVCPSYSEGMPNVILEAMASGLAVIATDVGAVSEMVSEKNGWLIDELTPEKLKQALIDAMKINKEELLNKKKYSVELVKSKFLWENIIQTTIQKIEHWINVNS